MPADLNRRDLLKFVSAAALTAPLALPAPEPGAPLYFQKDEFLLLDTLTELIIPADDHSPGAHAAGVAAYIDRTVAEAFLSEDKLSWRKGLASVNGLSQSMHGRPFLKLSKNQQISVVQKLASAEADNEDAQNEGDSSEKKSRRSGKFWGQLKNTTAFAYYTTDIGIHKEMEYKGNVILEKFVGYMPDDPLPPISSLGSS